MDKWPKSVSFAPNEKIRTSFYANIEVANANKDTVSDATAKGKMDATENNVTDENDTTEISTESEESKI